MKLTKTNTVLAITLSMLLLGTSFGSSAYAGINPTTSIEKFYDSNADGSSDGETFLDGWLVSITSSTGINYELTPYNAVYPFGSYNVSEYVLPNSNYTWANTTNAETFDLESPFGEFGNVCLGEGGAHSKGFWSNKNGQTLCGDYDNSPNHIYTNLTQNWKLVTNTGASFSAVDACSDVLMDKSQKPPVKNYFNMPNNGNAKYTLSQQLLTMILNNATESVNSDAIVYCPSIVPIGGGITVNQLMLDANATLVGSDTALINAYAKCLDDANNNLNFVQDYDTCMADNWNFDTTVTLDKTAIDDSENPVTVVFAGQFVNFTMTVENTGNFPAVNPILVDFWENNETADFVPEDQSACWVQSFVWFCTLDDLADGESFMAWINGTSEVPDFGYVNNTAVVIADPETNFDYQVDSQIVRFWD